MKKKKNEFEKQLVFNYHDYKSLGKLLDKQADLHVQENEMKARVIEIEKQLAEADSDLADEEIEALLKSKITLEDINKELVEKKDLLEQELSECKLKVQFASKASVKLQKDIDKLKQEADKLFFKRAEERIALNTQKTKAALDSLMSSLRDSAKTNQDLRLCTAREMNGDFYPYPRNIFQRNNLENLEGLQARWWEEITEKYNLKKEAK